MFQLQFCIPVVAAEMCLLDVKVNSRIGDTACYVVLCSHHILEISFHIDEMKVTDLFF